MNVLMIDTAEGCKVLLLTADKSYYKENLSNAGAETLMPLIDGVINECGIQLKDIDLFGACVGPGSFTGLRVGLATIKTFCYATGKRCFAVNNLKLNSYNNSSDKVVSIAHAGNNVCYIAVYDGDTVVEETRCVTADEAHKIAESYKGYAVSTDIKLSAAFSGTAGVGEKELTVAVQKHSKNVIDQKELLPLYVRKAQPERGEGDL
ncbi:MAG: tRNA (adenosine(37)-N6)-threonylcarbamoyltransferase complex dimerization subunit type 1 TsaB [Clostridiales bacterium]|nr:tRNA (adenosine(37)-N6)-threonylcarbamoyltransferase complex dimerization subunit type 1 TsaB [Clostridiales bacterium]